MSTVFTVYTVSTSETSASLGRFSSIFKIHVTYVLHGEEENNRLAIHIAGWGGWEGSFFPVAGCGSALAIILTQHPTMSSPLQAMQKDTECHGTKFLICWDIV